MLDCVVQCCAVLCCAVLYNALLWYHELLFMLCYGFFMHFCSVLHGPPPPSRSRVLSPNVLLV
jgi:hypothetical protein